MIMSTANIQFRLDVELKKQLEQALDDMGLDIATAMRMFAKKVVQVKTIPFKLGKNEELDENGFTQKEVDELLKAYDRSLDPKNLSPAFDDVEEAIAYLHRQH